ncbi:hypothetical protein WJX79_010468 [Trebouxia sp. C0005]
MGECEIVNTIEDADKPLGGHSFGIFPHERCGIEQQHVRQYLEGEGGPPLMSGDGSQALFLRETQQWIDCEDQAPVLRTLCNRAAFQESSNNEVRISLDSQLHMIRESSASPKQPGDWCRDLGGVLGSGDVTHFQYDVAEVKLGIKDRPAWIKDLVNSGLLLRVPKFSKYLHGVASLYPNRIEAIPYWFLPADKEGYVMTPASWEEMADPTDPYLKDAAAWLFPSTEGSRAAALLQPQFKPKQLTQRFNHFFWRKKPKQASSEEGFPKQQTHPKDLEAGADPRANSPISAQAPYDPSPPSGCSPKSALLRSGIFQNPKTPDQDKPLSPEQAERRARGLVRTRVEPKVFFANERTFLQWLQISVLLMFTGLSLLGGSSVGGSKGGSSGDSSTTCASNDTACKASKYAGVIISPIAILFMMYALLMYKRRTVQILRRANVRYDDQRGPVMLVILLIVATLASLVLTAYGTLR